MQGEWNLRNVNRKGKSHQNVVGWPAGGALTHVPLDRNTDPSKKRCYLAFWSDTTLLPPLATGSQTTAQPMRDCHNSMKSHCTLNSQFPPMDFLFITAPRNCLFSFIKVSSYLQKKKKKKKGSSLYRQQKSVKCRTWSQSQNWQNDLSSFPRQTIQVYAPNH